MAAVEHPAQDEVVKEDSPPATQVEKHAAALRGVSRNFQHTQAGPEARAPAWDRDLPTAAVGQSAQEAVAASLSPSGQHVVEHAAANRGMRRNSQQTHAGANASSTSWHQPPQQANEHLTGVSLPTDELHLFDQQVEQPRPTTADLQARIKVLETDLERFKRLWRDASARTMNRNPMLANPKAPDDYIRTSFLQLRYQISSWASEHFEGETYNSLDDRTINKRAEVFAPLCANYEFYLRTSDARPLLVQSYLWSRLKSDVFDNVRGFGLLWAGDFRDHLLYLQNNLRPCE